MLCNEYYQHTIYVDKNTYNNMKERKNVIVNYQFNGAKIITNKSGNKLYSVKLTIKIDNINNKS